MNENFFDMINQVRAARKKLLGEMDCLSLKERKDLVADLMEMVNDLISCKSVEKLEKIEELIGELEEIEKEVSSIP